MATKGTPKENPDIEYRDDHRGQSITIYYHDKINLAIGMEEIGAKLCENIFGWEIKQGNDPQRGDYFTFYKIEEEDYEQGVHETRTEWPIVMWPIHDRGGASSPTIRRRPR